MQNKAKRKISKQIIFFGNFFFGNMNITKMTFNKKYSFSKNIKIINRYSKKNIIFALY